MKQVLRKTREEFIKNDGRIDRLSMKDGVKAKYIHSPVRHLICHRAE